MNQKLPPHHNEPGGSLQETHAPQAAIYTAADKSGGNEAADYLVPDILQPGLDVVFCGTALGASSYRKRAYYANPGNGFWPALHRTGLTPHLIKPEDYQQLLQYKIGLTDLCKTAFGNDDELPKDAFDIKAVEEKILRYQPRFVAFTSMTAARAFLQNKKAPYGLQERRIGITQIYALSSPSGRARRSWREDVWQDLALCIKGTH